MESSTYCSKRVFEKSRFCHISPTMFPHSSFQTAGANPGPRTVSFDLPGLFKHPFKKQTDAKAFNLRAHCGKVRERLVKLFAQHGFSDGFKTLEGLSKQLIDGVIFSGS